LRLSVSEYMLRPLRPLGFDLHRVRGVFSQGPFYYPPPSYEHRLVRKHRALVERCLEVSALVCGVTKSGGKRWMQPGREKHLT
ncbi:MAG: hypothetical protein ACERKU_04860, partial [Nitrospirota bacterium]